MTAPAEPADYIAGDPDACMAEVGERIRAAREAAGKEQRRLAAELGVTQPGVSRWETGERDPSVSGLIRIAEALGVPAGTLLPAPHQAADEAPGAAIAKVAADRDRFARELAETREALKAALTPGALEALAVVVGDEEAAGLRAEIERLGTALDVVSRRNGELHAELGRRPGDQPLPRPADGPSMHDLVIADLGRAHGGSAARAARSLGDRKALGLRRYGRLLQAGNGRDALRDLLEELQDASVYCRQVIEENRLDHVTRNTMRVVYDGLLTMLLRVHEIREPGPACKCPEGGGEARDA